MKNIVKKGLNLLGLEVKRIDRTPFLLRERLQFESEGGDGKIIEFVGLPGVGKTFLLKHCAKSISDKFIYHPDFLKYLEVKKFSPELNDKNIKNLYEELIKKRVEGVFRDMESTDNLRHQVQRIQTLSGALLRNAAVDAAFPVNILTDEGISKNFTEVLVNLSKAGHEGALAALSRRLLVLVTADPATADAQLEDRQAKQAGSAYKHLTHLEGLSRDERLKHYSDTQTQYCGWINELEPFTRGVLRVSRNDDLKHNVSAFLEFVRLESATLNPSLPLERA